MSDKEIEKIPAVALEDPSIMWQNMPEPPPPPPVVPKLEEPDKTDGSNSKKSK